MMSETYKTAEEGIADKAQLAMLLEALDGQNKALRRDECAAWQIKGKRGHIYTWGDGRGFLLYVGSRSVRAWGFAKKRLAFCKVTQDGDDEGCLRLDRLPTEDEAEEIRNILGIYRRRSPESADHLRAHRFAAEHAYKG